MVKNLQIAILNTSFEKPEVNPVTNHENPAPTSDKPIESNH